MLLRSKDLAERWQMTEKALRSIPVEKLPRVNLSHGKKRPTWRYRLEDVEKFEKAVTVGGAQ